MDIVWRKFPTLRQTVKLTNNPPREGHNMNER